LLVVVVVVAEIMLEPVAAPGALERQLDFL
jgi:hypothetical protein